MILIDKSLEKVNDTSFWEKVKSLNLNDTNAQVEIYDTFYWLNSGTLNFKNILHDNSMCSIRKFS